MASIICPLDKEYSDIIAALLATPSPQSSQDYYDQLITEGGCHGLEIKQSEEHGKAVYASLEFKEGELVFRDQMLVGAQHSSNKVISFTILRYKKLKSCHQDQKQPTMVNGLDDSRFRLLLEAWKPISKGFKRRWWDCIALPDDVDCHDETSFRQQKKELAFTELLKEAIFDKEYAPLFSLEIYRHIIGMFELNNLDLVVASPVEDYFIYIDDLPYPDKEEAEKVTRPFLDALGDDYSVCRQGTAFFSIQSCMNHSCYPNAKAFKRDEDRDRQATIIALRPILKGEEITISYIDEDLPDKERQALLADYGFRCRCPKSLEEEA